MNIGPLLELTFCHSSYTDPITVLNGWRIFLDDSGFIPAAGNTYLVAKLLAWNADIPNRVFCSLVGFEHGAFEYDRRSDLPALGRCAIDIGLLRLPVDDMCAGVRAEIDLALDRLVRLLCATFDAEYRAVRLPVYTVTGGSKCPCCRQVMSNEVLQAVGVLT